MRSYKPLFISAFVFLVLNSITPVFAAYDINKAADELAKGSPIRTPDQIFTVLKTILGYMYTIFFFVAVAFILVAAYHYLFARGEPEKIKNATKSITWAVVAIAVALISAGAAEIIKGFFPPI